MQFILPKVSSDLLKLQKMFIEDIEIKNYTNYFKSLIASEFSKKLTCLKHNQSHQKQFQQKICIFQNPFYNGDDDTIDSDFKPYNCDVKVVMKGLCQTEKKNLVTNNFGKKKEKGQQKFIINQQERKYITCKNT